jgi:curved DNA-binding protein CbpA
MTHYDVLGVDRDASLATIRERYRVLVVQLHPDKARHPTVASFDALQLAWHTLRDASLRAAYDASLREQAMLAVPTSVVTEVDLDDMLYDEAARHFHCDCRCGERFVVTELQLERGLDTLSCHACSLSIRILYQRA